MRIALIRWTAPLTTVGPVETRLHQLIAGLARHGHDVCLIAGTATTHGPRTVAKWRGRSIVRVPELGPGFDRYRNATGESYAQMFEQELSTFEPDVVHAFALHDW